MKRYLFMLLGIVVMTAQPGVAVQSEPGAGEARSGQTHSGKMDCDTGRAWCKGEGVSCTPEMRGRCGKRRGDWYGARQPVTTADEARGLLLNYFAGQEYTVSGITEKKWGFRAEILDRKGTVVDRVMIDKRSGRIRSLY